MKASQVKDKSKTMWKEAVWAYFKVLSRHLSRETEGKHKTSVRIAGILTDSLTRNFPNRNQ